MPLMVTKVDDRGRRSDMKLVTAAVGYSVFVISIIGLIMLLEPSANKEPSIVQLRLTQSAVIGGFISWLSLLAHFFQNQEIKHRTLWGFSLIFLWWVAGPLYLCLHFRKSKHSVRRAHDH